MFIFVIAFFATRKTFVLLSFCIFVRVITLKGRMAAINRRQLLQALLLILRKRRQRRQKSKEERRKSRFWVRDIFLKRESLGEFRTLVMEMWESDNFFPNYTRFCPIAEIFQ